MLKWIALFSLIYILLLPLSGYRDYRPYVLRFDTMIPVTIALIFGFGTSALLLIKGMNKPQLLWYLPIIITGSFIFTYADSPNFNKNTYEIQALQKIAGSKEKIIVLEHDCKVLSWERSHDPADSEMNAQLLRNWNITPEKVLYYNE